MDGTFVGPLTRSAAPAGISAPARWQRWKPSVRNGVSSWLLGLAIYTSLTVLAFMPFDRLSGGEVSAPGTVDDLVKTWLRWDTERYLEVAADGYQSNPHLTAFFPLYPMLVRLTQPILPGDALIAALIVSVLACLATLIVLHRLAAELVGPADARRVGLYLLAFPTGFYLMAAYNESLFIALAVGSLYCMRRGRWWWAGLLAGFASATRMAGLMLAAAFVYEYVRQLRLAGGRRRPWDAFALLLAPAGLAGYAGYCQLRFGDPLFFLAQQAAWHREGFQPPWESVLATLQLIFGVEYGLFSHVTMLNIANLVTVLLFAVVLGFATVGRWRLDAGCRYLVIFAAAVLLMPLVNSVRSYYPLSSTWRFALECVVVFMFLARLGRDHRFDRLYLCLMWAIQSVMVIAFLSATFVA